MGRDMDTREHGTNRFHVRIQREFQVEGNVIQNEGKKRIIFN